MTMATTNFSRTALKVSPLILLLICAFYQDQSVYKTFTNSLREETFTVAKNGTFNTTATIAASASRTGNTATSNSATDPILQENERIRSPLPILNESCSACLLVMDENFRLHEWISYHYHVLPLRYLVVAVDPRSQHLPDTVFDQFREQLNMTIVSWNDTDFLDLAPLRENARPKRMRQRHLARQRRFLERCLRHLHEHNRTWTALWDTDEYIAYNTFDIPKTNKATHKIAMAPQNMSEDGTILRYLKDFGEEKCVVMPRVLVGNKETPGLLNESHPFDPRRFDTLRFRFRGRTGDRVHGYGKSLLNVQQIPSFPVLVRNPHRPVVEICPGVLGAEVDKSPFYLNHFIGSWEAYSYRDDSRRGQEKNYDAYMDRAQQNQFYENRMAQWLPAFIESVGEERGAILLKDAGLDPEYNASFKIDAWKKRDKA